MLIPQFICSNRSAQFPYTQDELLFSCSRPVLSASAVCIRTVGIPLLVLIVAICTLFRAQHICLVRYVMLNDVRFARLASDDYIIHHISCFAFSACY